MRGRSLVLIPVAALVIVLAMPSSALAGGNARVSVDNAAGTYTRYDGGSDATTAACSTGLRAQNEPTVAVDPRDTSVVTSGANDYCAAIVNGDVWAGYYRSTDGGGSWHDSLIPGYPADSSTAGVASPVHGSCGAAGDPSQSFDNAGRLFYAFICFNRAKPINGGVFVSRYADDGATYGGTALVKKGTPSGLFLTGLFQDKINLVTDQSGGAHDGNVYVAWSQYNGFAKNNAVLLSRSTDHGATFSAPVRVSPVSLGTASFADLAVGPDGAVYLTFITYRSSASPNTSIWLLRSTNGGLSFGPPSLVSNIDIFDSSQFSGNGSVDCGDVPFDCPTGLTFSRFTSNSAVAADGSGVHVVWAAREADGQSKVFVRNSSDGVHFSGPPTTLDSVATGHQWTPDIASDGGTIRVVFYDSRADPAYSPSLPPGDTASGTNSGDVVNTFLASSTNGGASWAETQLTTAASNFNWETHGSRLVPFWGDYIYISAEGGVTQTAWTDSRDLVPGPDPRETGASDDNDGFDVFTTCPASPAPGASDPCLSQGGLDQNIYTART
jgi:hypothetical protein